MSREQYIEVVLHQICIIFDLSLSKCPESSTPKRSPPETKMEDHSKYQMMDDAVQPHTLSPVLLGPSERSGSLIYDKMVRIANILF